MKGTAMHVHSVQAWRIFGMNHPLGLLSFSILVGVSLPVQPLAAAETQNSKTTASTDMEAATRLQVFLDRAHFGPGKIDGHYGGFTEKALILYREAKGLPPVNADAGDKKLKDEKGAKDPNAKRPLPDLSDMDLSSVKEVFINYQVTEADVKSAGELPKDIPEMAKLKWLPYATVAEAVAEEFHCDLDFLKQLNPGKLESLKAGDTVKVPNVEPFDVGAVKDLPLLDLAASRDEAEDEGQGKKGKSESKGKDAKSEEAEPSNSKVLPASEITVKVNTSNSMVHLYEKDKLVAAYPVTIGSTQTKSPQGDWKVKGIARLPDFRYDKEFLNTGERGDKTYLLPPGPNNLVGVIWIATNRRGIGLHGTSEPDSIGRSASHGCIRLANWDIVHLATRVRAGVVVSIH